MPSSRINEAARHAGGLTYAPPEAVEMARGYMPHYLWIDDHFSDEIQMIAMVKEL